jgi:acetyl esterase/lipase
MKLILALCTFSVAATLAADPSLSLPLWPNGAPGDKAAVGEERDTTKPTDGKVADRLVIRTGNVSTPTLTLFRPKAGTENGAAVVVCPGGGYNILAWDLEGTEVCEWLNSIGVTGVLLKYRVPKPAGLEKHVLPLQDAQRALGLVRQHASEWSIDSKRIGILGFSAGGHLAAITSTSGNTRTYPRADEADDQSCRPDFTVLIYPAYLVVKGEPATISPELKITRELPPIFIAATQDDSVSAEGSVLFYHALTKATLPAELHIYPNGGHGYGLRPTARAVTTWPQHAEIWLRGLGVLEAKKDAR